MPLEIGENILHHERISQGQLQRGISAAIVLGVIQSGGGGIQAVKNAVGRIVQRLHIRDASVVIDGEVCNMAGSAANLSENGPSAFRASVLHVMSRLEVIQK